jgi:hypothetical protein
MSALDADGENEQRRQRVKEAAAAKGAGRAQLLSGIRLEECTRVVTEGEDSVPGAPQEARDLFGSLRVGGENLRRSTPRNWTRCVKRCMRSRFP